MRHLSTLILVVAMAVASVNACCADPVRSTTATTDDAVKALALRWFLQMQAGQIDRTQYTAAYSAQLTDEAVKSMSQHLNEYGASPKRAEILQKRSAGTQTLYLVKLIFPRGDAASVLFGLDSKGKISAISIASMAGD
jgi:hypothetical protein